MRYNHKGIIAQSIIVVVGWAVILLLSDYPAELWVSVVVVGCGVFYCVLYGVGSVLTLLDRLALSGIPGDRSESPDHHALPNSLMSSVALWLSEFIVTVMSGILLWSLTVELTNVVIQLLGLVRLPADLLFSSRTVSYVGLGFFTGFYGKAILHLVRSRNGQSSTVSKPLILIWHGIASDNFVKRMLWRPLRAA